LFLNISNPLDLFFSFLLLSLKLILFIILLFCSYFMGLKPLKILFE
jgi:hypothetical protein